MIPMFSMLKCLTWFYGFMFEPHYISILWILFYDTAHLFEEMWSSSRCIPCMAAPATAAWLRECCSWYNGLLVWFVWTCVSICINIYNVYTTYIYIYSVYIHIYIYASPPLRSTFDAFPETCMMKLTAYFNKLCSEFDHENCVRSSKKQYPYNM